MTDITKIARVLKFVSGARVGQIFSQLSEGGFTEAELARGVELLKTAAVLAREPQKGPPDEANLIERCEAFQRRWFRPVRAALTRSFPEIAEEFFQDFTVETGVRAVVSVEVFLRRLNALGTGGAPFGADGPEARKLLIERKLTLEVEAEALALVAEFSSPMELREVPERAEKLAEAVKALWAWYLDWSGTARTVVTKKPYLRALGFSPNERQEEDEESDANTPNAPASFEGTIVTPPKLPSAPPKPAPADASTTKEPFPSAAE